MRLSVDKDSPFYDEAKLNARPKIFVDGVSVTHCFEASEEEGWVDRYVTDAAGKVLLNEAKDAALRERRLGKVEIRLRKVEIRLR